MKPESRHLKILYSKKKKEMGILGGRRPRKTMEIPTQIKIKPTLVGLGYKERAGQKNKRKLIQLVKEIMSDTSERKVC